MTISQSELVTATTAFQTSVISQLHSGKTDTDKSYHISLWDFGGQFVYYSTHQLFHSKESVYLLVFDLSKRLDEKVKDEIGREKSLKDYLEFWVYSIHCFVGGEMSTIDKSLSPCIVLIGTHKNDPKSKQYGIKKYFTKVRKMFFNTYLRNHFHKDNFAVDNCMECDEMDYERLRKAIENVSAPS